MKITLGFRSNFKDTVLENTEELSYLEVQLVNGSCIYIPSIKCNAFLRADKFISTEDLFGRDLMINKDLVLKVEVGKVVRITTNFETDYYWIGKNNTYEIIQKFVNYGKASDCRIPETI